ncbi:heterokaryon incompatibility protein-domain-containing protein [Paramyrothecium foliicola]|nr:heterokaryon incompatibility protein-domain-containing protein [Paramyrothecium foliicola]
MVPLRSSIEALATRSVQSPRRAINGFAHNGYGNIDIPVCAARLLRILPSIDPSSPVDCRLEHVLLEAGDVSYEALSYTWGSGHKTHAITLDGRPFPVTSNLMAALLRLRYQEHDRYLWVDAVCINQNDIAERSREVLRMLLIYQRAEQVVVWLGDQSYNSGLAMDHFRQLDREWNFANAKSWSRKIPRFLVAIVLIFIAFGASLLGTLRNRPYVSLWSTLFMLGWLPAMPFWLLRKLLRLFSWYTVTDFAYTLFWTFRNAFARLRDQKAQPGDALVRSRTEFFDRSWFQRVWIVQEIAAARDVMLFCGPHVMSWQALVNACHEIQHRVANATVRSPYNDTKFSRGGSLRSIVSREAWDEASNSEPDTSETTEASARYLMQLLGQFRYCQATDDRDQIYALLGLAFRSDETVAGQQLLVPDYSKPTSYVYSELVRLLVTSTDRLDILRYCEGYSQQPGLPSWAPDWTVSGVHVSPPSALSTKGYTIPSCPELPAATFSEDL